MKNIRRGVATKTTGILIIIVIVIASLIYYSNNSMKNATNSSQGGTIYIRGSGASFPYPLIQTLIDKYQSLNPDIQIDYASLGSGAGQANLLNKLVDFAASDAPLTNEQLNSAESWIIHIPWVLGAVVLAYNIPGFNTTLKLDGELIAEIFGGKIRKWNDPKLVSINPSLSTIDKDIFVIHRSDASGTTFIFSSFLSKESVYWRDNYGAGKAVNWPILDTFLGGKGNEGVTGLIKQTVYSIGYIEYTYAIKTNISFAEVKNKSGRFIKPSLESISASALIDISKLTAKDLRISRYVIDSNSSNAYPISAPSYLLVYQDWSVYNGNKQEVIAKAEVFKSWVKWILISGTKYFSNLGYAPIPDNMKNIVLNALDLINYNGEPIP